MLGRTGSDAPELVVEKVRQAMLRTLDMYCGNAAYDIDNKISDARDIETLWYLRSDLMHTIASFQSEVVARDCIEEITPIFEGHQPGGRSSSRFGSL
jgi:hypothetical protein